MANRSRGLREAVVRALARVGLVWVLAVLGALFMAMSAQGQRLDGGYSAAVVASAQDTLTARSADTPSTAGLVLALLVLGLGAAVLLVGSIRANRDHDVDLGLDLDGSVADLEPAPDLQLSLGLGLLV